MIVVDFNPNTDFFTNINMDSTSPQYGEVTEDVYYLRLQNGSEITPWNKITWTSFVITDNNITPQVALTSSASKQFLTYMY